MKKVFYYFNSYVDVRFAYSQHYNTVYKICQMCYNIIAEEGIMVNTKIISANLKRFRLLKNTTQEDLAKKAGISLAGYRNFESGRTIPKITILMEIAKAMGLTLENLVTEIQIPTKIRFRCQRSLKTRDQILIEVIKKLNNFNYLENILKVKKSFKYESSFVDPIKAANEMRKEADLKLKEPIMDICGLIEEKFSIKIIPIVVNSNLFFGLSIGEEDGGPAIVVNIWERIPVERWIFTVAHEFGHIILHKNSFNVNATEEIKTQEDEANKFASYFLMPDELFNDEWQKTEGLSFLDRVFKLKRICRVSYKTVLYRLQEKYMEKYPDVNIWKEFNLHYKHQYNLFLPHSEEPLPLENWAANEPKRLDNADFSEDRLAYLVKKALLKEHITRSRAAEILGISNEEISQRVKEWIKH